MWERWRQNSFGLTVRASARGWVGAGLLEACFKLKGRNRATVWLYVCDRFGSRSGTAIETPELSPSLVSHPFLSRRTKANARLRAGAGIPSLSCRSLGRVWDDAPSDMQLWRGSGLRGAALSSLGVIGEVLFLAMFMYRATKPVAERIRRSGLTHVSQIGGEQPSPLSHMPGVAI
jgi:hypothetical protein